MTRFGQQVYALLAKDLLVEIRTKDALSSVLVFALLVLVTFNFALDLRPEVMAVVGPGILWIAVVFAGTIGLGRSFAVERDQGTLESLLMAPLAPGALFVAKLLTNLVVMAVAEAALLPAFVALFDLTLDLWTAFWILLLGSVGLAAVGTLFAALAAQTRARELLLPVLLFPVIVPLLIAVVEATGLVMGSPVAQDRPWVPLLLAFDAIYLSVGLAMFEYVLEE